MVSDWESDNRGARYESWTWSALWLPITRRVDFDDIHPGGLAVYFSDKWSYFERVAYQFLREVWRASRRGWLLKSNRVIRRCIANWSYTLCLCVATPRLCISSSSCTLCCMRSCCGHASAWVLQNGSALQHTRLATFRRSRNATATTTTHQPHWGGVSPWCKPSAACLGPHEYRLYMQRF